MKNPNTAEVVIARANRDKVHPDVALHTHVAFMNLIELWQDDIDPFVQWKDYTRQDFDDVMQDLMSLYENKKR